jgi:hypothetical protein
MRINMRWYLKTPWCVIPKIAFPLGVILSSYSGDVRMLSSLWPYDTGLTG